MSASSLRDRQRRREEGWKMPEDFTQRMLQTRRDKIQKGLINPYSEETYEISLSWIMTYSRLVLL